MGFYKELDITYQEIVDEYVSTGDGAKAEKRIWDEIGIYDWDLADKLTDSVGYEWALVQLSQDKIPHDNLYWQTLVIRTAYNLITDIEQFIYICEHSRFTQEEVQRMIDLAVGAVLSNPRFCIENFQTYEGKRNLTAVLEAVA
jgi:hypothetical protein